MLSKQLELLAKVTTALTRTLDLQVTLEEILSLFNEYLGMNRGTVTLLEKATRTASIVSTVGLSRVEKKKGLYKLGEGITGHVLQSGEPVVISRISKDPRFLNKTGSRSAKGELSFICVPIILKSEVIGTLSADRDYKSGHNLSQDLQVLDITASIVSHLLDMYNLRTLDRNKLIEENINLKKELIKKFQFKEIIGHSDKITEVLILASQVSKSNATVMVRGESGTGKELIAHAIHYNSERAKKPFIKVNCSAIPDSLLESELFGFEKGAFTGALNSKPGKFEQANGGTIFLDEIGDFPLTTQIKLLRVIQSREVERLGATKVNSLDIRIIVATNRNLEKEMEEGIFREDLYYRINVFPIYVPPLRERKTDILLLAEFFLKKFAEENSKIIKRISTPAINMLMSYHWPGNVRELQNCIERAVLVCDDDSIKGNHLPPTLQIASSRPVDKVSFGLKEAVENLEQELILESLKRTNGHQAKTAVELAITERILGYKLKKYNISPKVYTSK